MVSVVVGGGAEVPVAKEYQIKVAFLYNFTKFVEWPAESSPDDKSPIVIGVFGQNPFGAELQEVAKDRKVNGRAIVVREVQTVEQAKTVHVLFFAAAEDKAVGARLKALNDRSILTVGESEEFVKGGGMINFILEGDKVRFEINVSAAERAKLRISAQLQKLARNLRENR